MASGKLSARQKMINMMYLVLMALLALNVSAEILQAFESLRNSLEGSAQNYQQTNMEMAGMIRDHINKEIDTDNHSHEYMLDLSSDILNETKDVASFLEELVMDLEIIGEKDPESGEIKMKEERDDNYTYWMGKDDHANDGKGEGQAHILHKKLDGYINWANNFFSDYDSTSTGKKFGKLAIEPQDDPTVSEGESKSQSWEFLTFHQKPLIADLAMLGKFKMDVRKVESELLQLLKDRLKPPFTVDKMIAVQAPASEIVPAGAFFEAKLFPALSSKNVIPEFIGNGITIDPTNPAMANIRIPASASVIPEGETDGIQHWSAMIKVPMSDGSYKELPVEGQFTVRKPEIVVRSTVVQILYKDCGNKVIVDVPALGDLYNPDFSGSTGGKILKSENNIKEITIVPGARNFNLAVASNTSGQRIDIGKIKYTVEKPALPRFALEYDRKEYFGTRAISKKGKITVKIIPDEQFKKRLPRDARYRIDKIKIMHQYGITAPRVVKEYNVGNRDPTKGIEVSLYHGTLKQADQGDRFYIEIEGLKRINFQNEKIPLNLGRALLLKPGVLK